MNDKYILYLPKPLKDVSPPYFPPNFLGRLIEAGQDQRQAINVMRLQRPASNQGLGPTAEQEDDGEGEDVGEHSGGST
jgi:hypothetical protein